MAMVDPASSRRADLIAAITAELQRQADKGATRIDVEALADVLEEVLSQSPPHAQGKRPDQLNATNDD